jgi:hypothetical protein
MSPLLETLTAVASAALAGTLRRAAVSVVGLLVSAALLMTSLAFFTLAAYRGLAEAVGTVYAPLIVGTAYLVLALTCVVVAQARR